MISSPILASCISLTISQLRILRFVYQASLQHPQLFMLEIAHADWDVLAAYRLLHRRLAKRPTGQGVIEYRLSSSGRQLMKSLEV